MSSIIKLLRKIGGPKATPTTGSAGELAIWKAGAKTTDAMSLYAHDGTQWIEVIDTRGQVVAPKLTTIASTAPGSPQPGDMWLNSATNLLSIWDGATWCTTDTHQAATSVLAPVNPTTGSMWLDPGKKDLMVWDGSQWANVAFKNVTNTFIQPQIIDVNDASAALHIKQLGTGAALYIEDETNPDATPFVVQGNGNVGIGVPNPSAKLEVDGPVLASDANNASVKAVSNGVSASLGVQSSRYWAWLNRKASTAMVLRDESIAVDRIIVTDKGEVGIDIAPADKLHVNGGVRSSGTDASFAAKATGGYAFLTLQTNSQYWRWITNDGNGSMRLSDETGGYVRFAVAQNGAITALGVYGVTGAGSNVVVDSTGNIMRTSSSLKYKKNVEPLDHAIADNAVRNLKPVWYRHKKVSGDDKVEWSHIGLIAEDVAKVEKRLVNFKTVDVTFEKKTVTREDGTTDEVTEQIVTPLAEPIPEDVDYARLSVLLLDYIQRLEKRVAVLEARP